MKLLTTAGVLALTVLAIATSTAQAITITEYDVTIEGDATAHLLAALARKHGLRASRIAYGIPVGGELEYVDGGTLARALSGRRAVESQGEGERS